MSGPYKTQILTRTLSNEVMEAELPFVAEALREVGMEKVFVRYWGGEVRITLTNLAEVFHAGFEGQLEHFSSRWQIGSSDFEIYNDAFDIEVELCHQHHIHVRSNDEAIVDKFRLRWKMRGLYPPDANITNELMELDAERALKVPNEA